MNNSIKVKPPVNFHYSDRTYFPRFSYKVRPLPVNVLENVLVTYNGICLLKSGIAKGSIHSYFDKVEIALLLAKILLKKNLIYALDENNDYLLVHSPDFSYYHWFTESIPRIISVSSNSKNLVLLLPSAYRKYQFVNESLKKFKFKDVIYLWKNSVIKVNHLVLPSIKPFHSVYNPDTVNRIRELYTESYRGNCDAKSRTNAVFIYDKHLLAKELSNCDALFLFLKTHNIELVDFSNTSFIYQLQRVYSANLLIAITTNELACISFMQKGSSLLELLKRSNTETEETYARFLNLCSALDIQYYYQFCDPVAYVRNRFIYEVDIQNLDTLVSSILRIRTC